MSNIQFVEKPLSIHDKFRLVVIAHETSQHAIRDAALKVLRDAMNPLVFMEASQPDANR